MIPSFRWMIQYLWIGLLVGASSLSGRCDDADKVDFSRDIQPLLASRCFACHGPDKTEAGLDLSEFESAVGETDSGAFAIKPGDASSSTMLDRVSSTDEFERMPPEGEPLEEESVELLRRWIQQGADYKPHWAFSPRSNPIPPAVTNTEDGSNSNESNEVDPQRKEQPWVYNPIDAFVLKRLTDAGLSPAPPASKSHWIRRVTYDLTGLPPTRADISNFLNDERSDAETRVIDRLLSSPQYGVRWGRHWLDLVRFAETNSFERDGPKPNAWKYRDYVVDSLNSDKPYSDFVREQLAGDLFESVTNESLTATGYYRLGIWDDEPADPKQARFDEFDDLITTTSQAFLGLTVNCARCHDHKIDPIPQKDYYSFLALMADVTAYASRGDTTTNNQVDLSPDWLRQRDKELGEEIASLEKRIRAIEQESIKKMSAPDQRATEGPRPRRERVLKRNMKKFTDKGTFAKYQALRAERDLRKAEKAKLPKRDKVLGLAVTDPNPPSTHVLLRGNPNTPGDAVKAGFPSLFGDEKPKQASRLALADWMVDPNNRLAPRVIANRVWQFHFGRGLVRSSNNFGRLGTPPTHPELLDFLANELIRSGWSIKQLHRMILTSSTYRMSTQSPIEQTAILKDPANDLLWRFDPRRLSAEEVRDSVLAVADQLNLAIGGPSVYPTLSPEVLAGQSRPGSGWGKSSPADQNRRSAYIYLKRSLLTPILEVFDFPDPDQTCEARFQTLGPNQALALLNDSWMHSQSRQLADAISKRIGSDSSDDAFVNAVTNQILRRNALDQDVQEATRLMTDLQTAGVSKTHARGLYVLSVLNWNEFLFLD